MSDQPFVTIDRVAEHFVVSVPTVRAWLRNGIIPEDTYIKLGNTYRFDLPKLAVALVNAPKKPVSSDHNLDNNTDN